MKTEIESLCVTIAEKPAITNKYDAAASRLVQLMRSQHARDSEPPTREMYERLVASYGMAGKVLRWWDTYPHPVWFGDDYELAIDTVGKLRAVCLLLGTPTEGIL